jgi:hypothetical protein
MSDYRVTVKVRNARLLRAIKNAGYDSIPKFCADAELRYEMVNALINLTTSPLDRTGAIRLQVTRMMDFLCEPFEALFSPEQCEALATNKSERDVSAEHVFALLSQHDMDPLEVVCQEEHARRVASLLDEVPKAVAEVLRDRNGLLDSDPMSLAQVAAKRGVTQERVRQIEAKGLRILRRSNKAKEIMVDQDERLDESPYLFQAPPREPEPAPVRYIGRLCTGCKTLMFHPADKCKCEATLGDT